jgi:hypothetical protein
MTAAVDAEPCALVATAADIICSLRGADLAGWTPPWRKPADDDGREGLAWPSVARGKRSRSRRGSSPSAGSGSADATKKKKRARRAARGSPPSPLDYSAGSGASTSGGDDGAFCSPPVVLSSSAGGAGVVTHVEPVNSKVGLAGRRTIMPVPQPPSAGQRPRKKMRLPEIQQMVRSLSVENDALRQEMKALQKACTALSKENGELETRLVGQSNEREEKKEKPQPAQCAAEQGTQNGFALPDLNLPALDG